MKDKGQFKSIFRKINYTIGVLVNAFEVTTLCICVGLLSVLLIANVIAREFFISIYFAEEITEFLVIITTFVGLSYGVRKARHIRMGAIFDIMPPRVKKVLMTIIATFSAALMFKMAFASYDYLIFAMNRGHKTPALWLPMWIFYVIVPIGFFSASIQYARTIIKNVTEKETWMSPEQQTEYEEAIIGELK